VKNLFNQCNESVANIDAIVCIAGEAKWGPFDSMTEEDFYIGLRSKLMGQVNLVKIGQKYLNIGGSFTLTTGILADHPVELTTSYGKWRDSQFCQSGVFGIEK